MNKSFREYLASIDEETTSGDIASVDSVVGGASANNDFPKYKKRSNKDHPDVTDQASSEDPELQETQLD